MSFAVKLDESLSLAHVHLLRHAGYDADRVDQQGLSGATDEQVWKRVCADGRFFITLDLDFSDIRRYSPGTHPGILLIRMTSCLTRRMAMPLRLISVSASLSRTEGEMHVKLGPIVSAFGGVVEIERDDRVFRGAVRGTGRDARNASSARSPSSSIR